MHTATVAKCTRLQAGGLCEAHEQPLPLLLELPRVDPRRRNGRRKLRLLQARDVGICTCTAWAM